MVTGNNNRESEADLQIGYGVLNLCSPERLILIPTY